MAFQKPISQLLLIFFLLSTSLLLDQGAEARVTHHFQSAQAQEGQPVQGLSKEGMHQRRLMIGSRAPICTYNECRGCRFKCSAEQVPVDASDPMNSAYHYRCVCHR